MNSGKTHMTREILKMNSPEKLYILLGLVISVISGGIQASFPVLVSEIYDVSKKNQNKKILKFLHGLSCKFSSFSVDIHGI